MDEWIEKYLKLLFPIDRNNIRMEEAKKEKSNHIPTKLYKYRNFNSDYHINNFINDELSLSEANNLNDPFECSTIVMNENYFIQQLRELFYSDIKNHSFFNEEEKEKLSKCDNDTFFQMIEEKSEFGSKLPKGVFTQFIHQNIQELCNKLNQKISISNLNNIYICALSENNESSAMWAHYADDFKGFCIEYNFNSVPGSPVWCMLEPIVYQDKIPDFTHYFHIGSEHFNNLISTYASMIKGTDWAYEKEWRLILPLGKQEKDYFIVKSPKPTSIYLGLRIEKENEKKIIEIAKQKRIPVYKMIAPKETFKVQYKKIL